MTLAALLRHLAFAIGLALLSAAVVRGMIAARVLDRPDPRKVHTRATPKGGGRRRGGGVPGRHRRALPLRRVLPAGRPILCRRHRGLGGDRRRGLPGRYVRLEVHREAGGADHGRVVAVASGHLRGRLLHPLCRAVRHRLAGAAGDRGCGCCSPPTR